MYKTNNSNNFEELRLLSINEARKILGIRHESLKDFIYKGMIGTINIGNKKRIPTESLKKFVMENTEKIELGDENRLERDIMEIIRKK
jgi:predicted site-specific integrase-resolvase